MWVYTIDGFYSVVQKDDDHVVVRCRVKRDATNLQQWLQSVGSDVGITHTPMADYAYRMTLTRAEWAEYLAAATDSIRYANFKGEVAKRDGHNRADIYLDVWDATLQLQHGVRGHR